MPVYWEQFQPEPGRFDYATLDTLLGQAREHRARLVLLWFGTWKNGSSHYMPLWMKRDPERYPRVNRRRRPARGFAIAARHGDSRGR